jgi:hypothetical protein
MPLPLRALGVLSATLAVILTVGQGAFAASRTVSDATGDVYSLTDDAPTKVSGPDGDVVSVTTVHRLRTVRIVVRARHLSLDQTLLFAKIRTSTPGPAYFFNGTADIGMRMAIMTHGQMRVIRCPGIRMAFHPAEGSVMAVVPRTCLGSPRWVRAGAALATTESMIDALADGSDPLGGDAATGTIDVAGLDDLTRGQTNAMTPPLPLGPRVRVG